jgi:hypothetical protein
MENRQQKRLFSVGERGNAYDIGFIALLTMHRQRTPVANRCSMATNMRILNVKDCIRS